MRVRFGGCLVQEFKHKKDLQLRVIKLTAVDMDAVDVFVFTVSVFDNALKLGLEEDDG